MRNLRRFCIATLLGLGVVMMVTSGCQNPELPAFERAADEYPAALAQAETLGYPLYSRELASRPVPEADNMEPPLREARNLLNTVPFREAAKNVSDPLLRNAPLPVQRDAWRAIDRVLQLALEAGERTALDRQRNWDTDEPWRLEPTDLGPGRDLVRLLAARAEFRARAGDASGSLRDFRAATRLAAATTSEPTMVAGVSGIAEMTLVLREMERTLPTQAENPAYLANLRAILADIPNELDFLRWMGGETVTSLHVARAMENNIEGALRGVGFLPWSEEDGFESAEAESRAKAFLGRVNSLPAEVRRDAFLARGLQFFNRFFQLAREETDARKIAAQLAELVAQAEASPDPTQALIPITVPNVSLIADAATRWTADLRAMDGLIAALQFRAKSGRWPASLAEAGVNYADPHGSGPLRLRVLGPEIRVYSVGPNGTDEGGYLRTLNAAGQPIPADFGFVFPRTNQTKDTRP